MELPEEKLESKFDMTVADMKVIDTHRNDIHRLFLTLRTDITVAINLLDSCKCWYLVLMPYIYDKKEKEKFTKTFLDCYTQADYELKRLANAKKGEFSQGMRSGASLKFLQMVENLIADLYVLKNDKGLGIKQRKTFTRGTNPFTRAVKG